MGTVVPARGSAHRVCRTRVYRILHRCDARHRFAKALLGHDRARHDGSHAPSDRVYLFRRPCVGLRMFRRFHRYKQRCHTAEKHSADGTPCFHLYKRTFGAWALSGADSVACDNSYIRFSPMAFVCGL